MENFPNLSQLHQYHACALACHGGGRWEGFLHTDREERRNQTVVLNTLISVAFSVRLILYC